MIQDPNALEKAIAQGVERAACLMQGLFLLQEAKVHRDRAEWTQHGLDAAAMAAPFLLAAEKGDTSGLTMAQRELLRKREADLMKTVRDHKP